MKTRLFAAAIAALSLSLSASAGERTWYASVEGGAAFGSVSARGIEAPLCGTLLPAPPCAPDTSLDTCWAAIGAVGTHVAPNIRLEGEVGYRSQKLGGRGDLTQTTLMANALYDIPVAKELTLSLGGGLGWDWARSSDVGTGIPIAYSNLSDRDSSFAYQLIAGLSYGISDHVELTLNYRYTKSNVGNLYAQVHGAPADWDIAVDHVDGTSTVAVGLRFGF